MTNYNNAQAYVKALSFLIPKFRKVAREVKRSTDQYQTQQSTTKWSYAELI